MKAGRIVYLSDYFGSGGAATGGAGIAALESYEAVRAEGGEVALLSGYHVPDATAARSDVTLLGGRDLRAGPSLGGLGAIYNPASRPSLAAALAEFDPASTVVVLHQWTRWLSPSALGLLRPFRLMVYMHDYFWACPNGAYYDFRQTRPCTRTPLGLGCLTADCDRAGRLPKAARVARQALKALAAGSETANRLLLSISASGMATAERLLPRERHALVHNPLPASTPAPGRDQTRYEVGYFGRLEPEKGVRDLLHALQRTGRRGVFVGAGEMQAEITEALGKDAVIGWADHRTALRLMRACRAVVLASRWTETWGLVVAEALAQGRPVVVSRRAGAAELVERFGGGAIFDPDTPDGLEAALAAVLDGTEAADAAVRAAPRVREMLSPALHGRRIIGLAAEHWGLDVRRSAGFPATTASPPCAT